MTSLSYFTMSSTWKILYMHNLRQQFARLLLDIRVTTEASIKQRQKEGNKPTGSQGGAHQGLLGASWTNARGGAKSTSSEPGV